MESVDWLTERGVDFDRSVVEIPVGALWRRAHKPTRHKGVEFVEKLQQRILEQDGRIITDTQVTDLMMEDGKVVGVKATQANGTQLVLKVSHGVVLASGGFGANTRMIKQYNTYWQDIADDIKTPTLLRWWAMALKWVKKPVPTWWVWGLFS